MIFMTAQQAEDLGIFDSGHPITANVIILSEAEMSQRLRDLLG